MSNRTADTVRGPVCLHDGISCVIADSFVGLVRCVKLATCFQVNVFGVAVGCGYARVGCWIKEIGVSLMGVLILGI